MAFAGFVAGIAESVAMQPFEVTKIRIQAQSKPVSLVEGFRLVLRDRGIQGFYHGLSTQLIQTSVKTSLRFGIYSSIKPLVNNSDLAAGLLAGALEAALWIAPTERLKVLRITNPNLHTGITSSTQYLLQQGPANLWRGGLATVARNSFTVGLRFSLYENIRSLLPSKQKDAWYTPALLGFTVGFVSTILNNPIDVLKTKMNSTDGQSNISLVKEMWRNKNAWQGLAPRLLKISLGQAVIFSTVSLVNNSSAKLFN